MEKETQILNKKVYERSDTQNSNGNPNEVSLIDLILILWKYKFNVIICIILSMLIGIFYSFKQSDIYTTKTTFITKTKRNNNTALGQLAMLSGISFGSGGNIDPSEYLDKVIQDKEFLTTLFQHKWFFLEDSLSLEQIFEIKPDTTLSNWKYVYFISKLESIRKRKVLLINKDASTGILTLTTNAPSPQLSYDLNLYTIDYLSNYIRNSIKTQAQEKRRFIEERIKESKEELIKNENLLAQYKERNLMSNSPQVALEETRLIRNMTMSQEIYIQFQKQFELAKIEELDDQTLIQIVKNPEIPVKKSWPKRKLIWAVALLSGLFFGAFSAFFCHVFSSIKAEFKESNFVKQV